jgi:NAD(P)-dependent dehydrogenase (short-subunit alcohol dehydrogenase family)
MKDLSGKVAFITGGGSGVALGQAKVFAGAGMKVVIADIRQDHLDEALAWFAKRPGAQVHAIRLDVTDRDDWARAAEETERIFGPVQLLCNTAGVSQFGPMQNATYDDWDWQLSVNLGGVINGVQTFVPRMLAHGQGGHIVNTASMSAFLSLKGTGIYATTKFAVRGLSECLRLDLEDHGIGVSVLCPGAVNTNIHEAVLTRPAHLASTGYYGADPAVMAGLKAVIEPGLDPVELGQKVLEGVLRNDLYIIPYSEFRAELVARLDRVLAALPDPKDDPGAARRQAVFDARRRERAQEERQGGGER